MGLPGWTACRGFPLHGRLALIAGLSILAIDVPAQIIRTATLDYLYGSLLSLALIGSLLFPKFRRVLTPEGVSAPVHDDISAYQSTDPQTSEAT